jgi:hypothetical protein
METEPQRPHHIDVVNILSIHFIPHSPRALLDIQEIER